MPAGLSSYVFITKNSPSASLEMPDLASSLQLVRKGLDANEFGNFMAMLKLQDCSSFSNNLEYLSDTREAVINYTFEYYME